MWGLVTCSLLDPLSPAGCCVNVKCSGSFTAEDSVVCCSRNTWTLEVVRAGSGDRLLSRVVCPSLGHLPRSGDVRVCLLSPDSLPPGRVEAARVEAKVDIFH